MPLAPKGKIHHASGALLIICPSLSIMATTAESGPIAFATSFEPCAKAIAQAVISINMLKTFSTPPKAPPSSILNLNLLLRK